MVRPEHIATAQRLDLIASANSGSIGSETLVRLYGADEVYNISPIRSLLDAGLRVVMEAPGNTDQPPLSHIEKFVTRKDKNGRVWNEGQKVTRREALYMSTNWAAYYTGNEEILGTIEPGKLTDLVVIDGDYLGVPEDQIGELPIALTMVDSRIVFEAE